MKVFTKGIYKIINIINNKYYIGSSINIEKRFRTHINLLNRNEHHCKHLQNAWNKNGSEVFEFKIIENLPNTEIQKIRIIEQFYLDCITDWQEVYNIAKTVDKPQLNITVSEETRRKISNTLKGHKQKEETILKRAKSLKGTIFSEERKANISKAKLGYKPTKETIEKIRQANKGKIIGDYAREVARKLKTGVPLTDEVKAKISKANKRSGSSVYFDKTKNKWVCSIHLEGKNKHLGNFNTYEEALNARLEAEKKYW